MNSVEKYIRSEIGYENEENLLLEKNNYGEMDEISIVYGKKVDKV